MGQQQDTVQAFFDAFAANDMDAAETLFTPDAVITVPAGTMGLAEHRAMGETFKAAFPDSHMEVDRWLEDGDTVVVEGRFVGTHQGDLLSPDGTLPATGNGISLRFAELYRLADGRIAEQRSYWDQAALMMQLAGEA